jgi:small nuclear ribonucleoprotein (snRNP)-like protein
MALLSKTNFLLVTIFIILLITPGNAGEISVIELSDGSRITGEVVSFDGSTWIIKSESMGQLKIESSKVRSIRSQGANRQNLPAETTSGYQVSKEDIQAMQQSIMANQEILGMIMNLHDDPEIQAILKDPDIMNAVNAGNISALLANPKFLRLLEKAEIKAITGEIAK